MTFRQIKGNEFNNVYDRHVSKVIVTLSFYGLKQNAPTRFKSLRPRLEVARYKKSVTSKSCALTHIESCRRVLDALVLRRTRKDADMVGGGDWPGNKGHRIADKK